LKLEEVLTPGSRAAFYGRHSTKGQTLEHQRTVAYKFVEAKGCMVLEDYCDRGVSAVKLSIDQRKELKRLLLDAFDNKFDFVVVYMKDRLARNPIDHQQIRAALKLADKPVVIAADGTLYDDGDIFTKLLGDGMTKWEADNIRQRTMDGKRHNIMKGFWNGGKAPFGYSYNTRDESFIQIAEEIILVKEVFAKYLSGCGFEKAAREMPLNSYQGKDWTRSRVQEVITNPFYAGSITWNKRIGNSNSTYVDRSKWIEIRCPEIEPAITFDEWERAWSIYQKKSRGEWNPRFLATNYLLQGIAYCKHCGKLLSIKDQRTWGKTKIYGKKLYYCTCKDGPRIEKENAEKVVLQQISISLSSLGAEQMAEQIMESLNNDAEKLKSTIVKLEKSLSAHTNRIDTVEYQIKLLLKSELDETCKSLVEAFHFYRIDLHQRIKECRKRKEETLAKLDRIYKVELRKDYWIPVLSKLNYNLDNIETSELRQIIAEMIKGVWFHKDGKVLIKLIKTNFECDINDQRNVLFY